MSTKTKTQKNTYDLDSSDHTEASSLLPPPYRREASPSRATETAPGGNHNNNVDSVGDANGFLQWGGANRARNTGHQNQVSQISSEAIIGICIIFLVLFLLRAGQL